MNEFRNITAAEYHADPDGPRLSNSIAKQLLRSPAHAYASHPKLGGTRKFDATKSMDDGTIVHALLLDGGKGFVEINHDSYTTKAAKADRDYARANNLVPVLVEDLDRLRKAAAAIAPKLPFLKSANLRTEIGAYWETNGVRCRGLLDALDGQDIHDLKTAADANPEELGRRMVNYGYDIQGAAYLQAVETITEAPATFTFWFAELQPPFAVSHLKVCNIWRELGETKWFRAQRTWKECLTHNRWPEYPQTHVLPPQWSLNAL